MNTEKIKVLDQGYVRLVEPWGADERIIEAARTSTAKGFNGWGPICSKCGIRVEATAPNEVTAIEQESAEQLLCAHDALAPGDEKLLKFLWDNKHATPFEMAGMIVEVKAPIFVIREWQRHRTQSFNEMSARYVPLPDENYMPSAPLVAGRALEAAFTRNKQAASASPHVASFDEVTIWLHELNQAYEHAQRVYEAGIALGIPKELARLPVPVARYSAMRASANLRNWFAFLALRCDKAAQWEIRQYAEAVATLAAACFPRSYAIARESIGAP